MAVNRESSIEQKHRVLATAWGWFVEKIERTSRNGFPDRFYASHHPKHVCPFCNRGRVVLLEFKRSGGVLSAQQRLRHRELTAAGVEVHTVHSVAEANAILGIGESL